MKRIYLLMLAVLVLGIFSVIAVENTGYHKIKVEGGTLFGKITGNNKDSIVLFIAGSGPTDMNGNTPLIKGRNDSFLQAANLLAKEGVSVFRYDKRTAGKSFETFSDLNIEFDVFVDDCVAVIRYLKDIGYENIYIAGHSKGSLVGMLAALKEPVTGFISIAGAGFTVDIVLEKQLLKQLPEDSVEIQTIRKLREGKIDTSINDLNALFTVEKQKFILSWMKYDPAEIIRSLDIPVLIIQGGADVQVDMEDFEALKANNKFNSSFIDNMNHVLKKIADEKQNIASYSDPSYTVHEDLIKSIINFVN